MSAPETDLVWPAGYTTAPVVLFVDDEANILSALRRLLHPTGYKILLAEGGARALDVLAETAVDLVVSDMRMPEMDGAQLLSEVKQRWPQTVRILLTGYADVSSAIAAINDGGIYRYVAKPWNDAELLGLIEQALSWRGLHLEKERLEGLTQAQNAQLRELNTGLEEKVKERTADLQIAHQELTLAMEKLQKTFFSSVQVLAQLIELRAPLLAGHGRRVADVARRVGEKMGLSADARHEILLAALLHDIGKIGYPDTLLDKPMPKMTGEELSVARKHPLNGAAALMSMPDMRGVAEIIRSHHERWDGQGYPEGLSGENIPLGARILALANDFDAAQVGTISSKRMNQEEAKLYVIEGRKFRYDPAVCDAFAELIGRAPKRPPIPEKRLSGSQLEVGMMLARDLYSPEGILLLATEYVLDATLIKQIKEYERAFGKPLVVCVRAEGRQS